MQWVLIGMVAGSLVTSQHETKEACLGRVEILKENKVIAKCVEGPKFGSGLYYLTPSGSLSCLNSDGTIRNC